MEGALVLSDWILPCWREAAGLEDQLSAFPDRVAGEALDLIKSALDDEPVAADEAFIRALPPVRQAVITGLLLMALQQQEDPRLALWAAEYAERCAERSEGSIPELLTAHARFIRAWALALDGSRTRSQALWSEVERHYLSVSGDPTFPALTACALGALALEADDIRGERVGISGAQEAFSRAWELAMAGTVHPGFLDVRERAERLLTQRGWLDGLLASPQPQRELDQWSAWVDSGLVALIRSRMRHLAVSSDPIAAAYHAGELADLVNERLETPPQALSELTGWLMHARRMEQARWVLLRRLETDPEDQDLLRHLAQVYVDEGHYTEALPLLGKLVTATPDDPYVRSMAATTLLQLGNILGAYQEFTAVLRLHPDDSMTQAMVRKLRPAACIQFEDGALRYHPDISQLSEMEMKAGVMAAILAAQPELIQEKFQSIVESEPDVAALLYDILITRGVVSEPEPEGAQRHLQEAEDHFAKGEWSAAIAAYEAALREDHDLGPAYMGLGDVHYREGRFYLARAFFEESVAVQPSPLACRFLGDTLRRMGKLEQAVDYYLQALELLPGYSGARQSLEEVQDELLRCGRVYRASEQSDEESAASHEPFERLLDLYAARFEPRDPNDLPELERAIGDQLPALGKALALQSPAERIAVMRREASLPELEQAILALAALSFCYCHHAGRPDAAAELCRFRLSLAEELGRHDLGSDALKLRPERHRADALVELASLSAGGERYQEALDHCRAAERAYAEDARERKRRGLPPYTAFDRHFVRQDPQVVLFAKMSAILEQLGDAGGSHEYGERASELDRKHPSLETQIQVNLATGQVALQHGEADGGLRALWNGLDLALEDRMSHITSRHVAAACHCLGQAHASLRLARMARHWFERALDLNRRAGHRNRQRQDRLALVELFTARPDLGDAAEAQLKAALLDGTEF